MSNTIKTRLQLKHDTLENWEKSELTLALGEVAFAQLSDGSFQMRVGVGDKKWSELSASPIKWSADQIEGLTDAMSQLSTTHYEKSTEAELFALSSVCTNGDTGVVKTQISGNIYSYKAYVFDGTLSAWKAMDGNYSANNVYFENDITAMYTFGKHTGTDASPVTIDAKGMTLAQVFEGALTKVNNAPSVTNPTCDISIASQSNKEIGSTVNSFTWSRSYTDGSYGFGRYGDTKTKSAGCELSSSTVTCSKELTDASTALSATSGTAYLTTPVTLGIGSNTIATMNLTCNYEASPYEPANNIGGKATEKSPIAAGSKTDSATLTVSGYRQALYIGTTTQERASDSITSDFLKGVEKVDGKAIFSSLKNETQTNNNKKTGTYSITVPVGAKTIVIASYDPSSNASLSQVLNTTVNADMTESFNKTKLTGVMVNGATDADAAKGKFTVWTFSPAEPYGSTAALTIKIA